MIRACSITRLFLALLGLAASPALAASPPARPPIGLTLRMEFVRARDGDTLEARVHGSAFVFAIRLIDVWAPELDSSDARLKRVAAAGRDFVTQRCKGGDSNLTVFVPFKGTEQPLKALTFDRVPAWVYVGDERVTLNEQLVKAGYASAAKGGRLGE